jgi:hypothetical protein
MKIIMKRITGETGYTVLACLVSFTALVYIIVVKKMMCVCRENCKKKVVPLSLEEA